MNNYGFYLSKLSLRGKSKEHAEVTFYQGVNLISGASNTGKTFVFQCIDFIFGGREIPKNIVERKGYDTVFLELDTYNGATITLRRNLTDKKMYKYECRLNEIDKVAPLEIKNQHDKEDPENISSILLNLCNSPYKNIVKNKKGITVSFSFRDFVHVTMLSEKRIINSISPIYPEDSIYTKTKSESAFRTIMTGNDDSFYAENKQENNTKIGIKANLEMVDSMILDTRIGIEDLNSELKERKFDIEEFEKEIRFLKKQISNQNVFLDKYQKERNEYWSKLQDLKSEKMLLSETVQRFNLLKKNYESDLNRLDFIEESIFYTAQLVDIDCPVCGNGFNSQDEEVKNAVLVELQKTKMQLNDLMDTIEETQEKEHAKESEINETNLKIKKNDEFINEYLQPILIDFKNQIDNMINLRDKFKMKQFNEEKLKELIRSQKKLKEKMEAKVVKAEFSNNINQKSLNLFSQIVQEILTDWHLEEEIKVEFNEEKKDIVVNGRDKEGFGKGYTAILNSAFIIGFLEYTIKLGLPHPRIVVIDSPLTTYKEKDAKKDDSEQLIKEEVKDAFFESLSNYDSNVQFIILENIEPKKEIHEKINYCRFTGNNSIDRYGFIPNNINEI